MSAFGRIKYHDPGNRAYPVRGFLFGEEAPLVTKNWWRRGVWDQGQTSSCTAHAAAGLLFTSPNRTKLARTNLTDFDSYDERVALYEASQDHDPWPGNAYDGTSTDAPLRLLRERGHIAEWRWAFGIEDVARTISHVGPVAVGIMWRTSMMDTDDDGFIRWHGDEEGGHCVELLGFNAIHRYFTGMNSWGADWGYGGRFRITWDDLDAALRADGEAATVVLAV
jgi:hypothetical protein